MPRAPHPDEPDAGERQGQYDAEAGVVAAAPAIPDRAVRSGAGFGPELFTAMAIFHERISATSLAKFTPEEAEAVSDLAVVLKGSN